MWGALAYLCPKLARMREWRLLLWLWLLLLLLLLEPSDSSSTHFRFNLFQRVCALM